MVDGVDPPGGMFLLQSVSPCGRIAINSGSLGVASSGDRTYGSAFRRIRDWRSGRPIHRGSPRCDRPFVVLKLRGMARGFAEEFAGPPTSVTRVRKGSLLTNTRGRNSLSANVFVMEGVRGVRDGLFLSDTSQIIAMRIVPLEVGET